MAGEIAAAAEQIILQVDAINHRTLAYKGQLAGRLKLSVVSTGKYVMPYFLSDFMQQHSGVELIMDVTNKSKADESLENNEVDFSLVSVLPTGLQVEKLDLLQNKLFLVGNAKAKFGKQIRGRTSSETCRSYSESPDQAHDRPWKNSLSAIILQL